MSLCLQCCGLVTIPFFSRQTSPEATFLDSSKVSGWEGQEVELPSHKSHVNLLPGASKCEPGMHESERPNLCDHTSSSNRRVRM